MSKVLVLCSGGLDSTVLLRGAVAEHGKENVYVLNLYYGQRNKKEREGLLWQVARIWTTVVDRRIHCIERDLSEVFTMCKHKHPMFEGSEAEVPEGTYADQMKVDGKLTTYVPFRNGLFLSYAAAIALQLECDTIAYGAHADDAAGDAYPDCTPEFISAMSEAIKQGTGNAVNLSAPFQHFNKHGIVEYGITELHMTQEDFNHTWSCYKDLEEPCGTCGTCLDRLDAFIGTGLSAW